MGIVKEYSRPVADAGRIDRVQTLIETDFATNVLNYGVTTLLNTTDDSPFFVIDLPVQGVRKSVLADMDSTGIVTLISPTTLITFFGSTANAIVFTTGATPKSVELVGISATQWGVVSQSTGVSLAGSTRSAGELIT